MQENGPLQIMYTMEADISMHIMSMYIMSKHKRFWYLLHMCKMSLITAHADIGFIQASQCKIQGLLKDFPTVFKD